MSNVGIMTAANSSSPFRRLLATVIQTAGTWRIESAKGRLVVSRGPLAVPYFSPNIGAWLLFLFYEAYVLSVGQSSGWHGIEVLAAPGLLFLFLGRAFRRSFQLESVTFDEEAALLTVEGIEGTSRTSKSWPYRKLRRVSLVHSPARSKYQVTTYQVVLFDMHDQVVASVDVTSANQEAIFQAVCNRVPPTVAATRCIA